MARSRTSARLLLATALLALPPLWALWSWKRGGPLAMPSTVLIHKGATVNQIADQLEREGVIRSAAMFKLWARARRLQLIRGEYTFQSQASLSDVAGKLRRGEIHFTNIIIPYAASAWNVQARLKDFVPEEVFWKLWKSPALAASAGFPEASDLEGLVAPATYRVHHAMEPEEILLQMAETFRRTVRPKLEGGELPPYQSLILASLAEKETNLPEELPRVAGVYARRLRLGMRLQCDPTSLYARWLSGDLHFTAPLREDLVRPHPFNTYAVAGLPPTPICIPSPGAIEAAKHPEAGADLYFVATGTGGHHFARTLSEHNRNVARYRAELARQRREAGQNAVAQAKPREAAGKGR